MRGPRTTQNTWLDWRHVLERCSIRRFCFLSHVQIVVSPADVYVGTNVIRLDAENGKGATSSFSPTNFTRWRHARLSAEMIAIILTHLAAVRKYRSALSYFFSASRECPTLLKSLAFCRFTARPDMNMVYSSFLENKRQHEKQTNKNN